MRDYLGPATRKITVLVPSATIYVIVGTQTVIKP
jgi:hypothetical protein